MALADGQNATIITMVPVPGSGAYETIGFEADVWDVHATADEPSIEGRMVHGDITAVLTVKYAVIVVAIIITAIFEITPPRLVCISSLPFGSFCSDPPLAAGTAWQLP
jgi:hypothetical protein